MDKQAFFENAKSFRVWLEKNHQSEDVLWVCYYKKHTKLTSITWEESVVEALCYGWIDGIRKTIDDKSYRNRFTPRRKNSNWSKRNIDTVEKLIKQNRMTKVGLMAYRRRKEHSSSTDGNEIENYELSVNYIQDLKKEDGTWVFYNNLSPSVRKQSVNWIMSAKKEETRDRRFGIFLDSCRNRKVVPQLRSTIKKKGN